MIRFTLRAAAAVALVATALGGASAQQIQRWTDEKGQIHFSNVGGGKEAAEAPAEEASPPEPAAPAPPGPETGAAASEAKGPYSHLGDDELSAAASRERLALKREIGGAKRRIEEIDREIANLRSTRRATVGVAIGGFEGAPIQRLGVVGAAPDIPSEREEALANEKEAEQEKIQGLREKYEELREETVKRQGSAPSWLLPLD